MPFGRGILHLRVRGLRSQNLVPRTSDETLMFADANTPHNSCNRQFPGLREVSTATNHDKSPFRAAGGQAEAREMAPAQRSTLATQAKTASPAVRDGFEDSQEATARLSCQPPARKGYPHGRLEQRRRSPTPPCHGSQVTIPLPGPPGMRKCHASASQDSDLRLTV